MSALLTIAQAVASAIGLIWLWALCSPGPGAREKARRRAKR